MSFKIVSLGEIINPAKLVRAGTDSFPILSMTMRHGLVDQREKFNKRVASSDTSPYKVVAQGQLVVGFPIDEGVLAIQSRYPEAIVSPAYEIWDISNQVHGRYLERYLRSPQAIAYYRSKLQGTTARRRSLPRDLFLDTPVPLPSNEEQQRIAEVLDRMDVLRAKRGEAIALLDNLTQSIFRDMFGEQARAVTVREDLKHPAGWSWEPLTEVAELATGHTPDRSRPEYWGGTIPWINLKEIRDLDGKIATGTQATVTPAGIANSSAVILPPGTVCFSRTASIGFVTIAGVPLSTSQDFVNWICGVKLNPKYLMHALSISRQHLRAISDGSTHKTIYMRLAEKFRTLLPPIELQKEFENRVAEAERLKAAHLAQMESWGELYTSVQQRAFRGDLWDNSNI